MDSTLAICFERDIVKDMNTETINVSIDLNGKIIADQSFLIEFLSTSRNRTILNIPLLQFDKFGKLTFSVKANKKLLSRYSINVAKSDTESQIPNTLGLQPISNK